MEQALNVAWEDLGREPKCEPNPEYPDGVDVDISGGALHTCFTELPYPADRCGRFHVTCPKCGIGVVVTTAGRPDDPKSVRVPCRAVGNA